MMKKNLISTLLCIVIAVSGLNTFSASAVEVPATKEATEDDSTTEGASDTVTTLEEYIDDVEFPANTETISIADEEEASEPEEDSFDEESYVVEEEIVVPEEKQAVPAEAVIDSGSCGEDAIWTLTGSGDNLTLIISGSGETYDYSESSIPWSSKRSMITAVVVNEGITSIGERLFYSLNKLTDVSLPITLSSIGGYGFSNCVYLERIAFPDHLESIGYHAFSDCNKLTDIKIPNSVTEISTGAFENCSGLTSITIPDGVTTIACALFSGCKRLKSVMIPDSVTVIESEAFSECSSLESIALPNGVSEIGVGAFHVCENLRSIVIPDGVSIIEGYTFHLCKNLKTVTMPENIARIDEYAFADCASLTSISIPEGTTGIGNSAFSNCTSLGNIILPDSVTDIGYWAFIGCSKLNSITIPDSVSRIDSHAFGYSETNIAVRFRGSKAQWDSVVGDNEVFYKSIVYNCFSVPADFKLAGASYYTYTGKAFTPAVTVTYNGQQLAEGVDFRVEYMNNINTGIAMANIIGTGDYFGKEPVYFMILPGATKKVTCTNVASGMKVSWEKVTGATKYKVYRNNELVFTTSALVVTDKEVKYDSGTKYTYKVVALEKNAGDSKQSRTAQYYRLMPVGIKSVRNTAAGKMTVTYDKSNGSSGYVVRYGLKSDMSDAKVITVKGQDTLSRTFDGMIKGKKYYVQVRTYKIEKGVRYYSGYCTTKTVKIVQ